MKYRKQDKGLSKNGKPLFFMDTVFDATYFTICYIKVCFHAL